MKTSQQISILAIAVIGAICATQQVLASPVLGSDAANFTVLGATTVTNVPTSTIVGSVGTWSAGGAGVISGFNSAPGAAVSDPQVTGGTVDNGTASAQAGQGQLAAAAANLASLGSGTTLTNPNLGGLTLAPGIYTVPAGTTNLAGTLTLDGGGNANAVWVFQLPGTLITSPDAIVNVINTGSGAGVYWDVGSSATIDADTTFIGNIVATDDITVDANATDLCGRALSGNGAVTLDQNSLSDSCSGSLTGTNGLGGGLNVSTTPNGLPLVTVLAFAPVNGTSIPEPATILLLGLGLAGLAMSQRRRY